MTINEIAKIAGVSKATVSRVLNNKPDVLPETRENIKSIIAKYDFQPNAYAKAITNRSSKTLGLLILNDANYVFSNPYYNEILRGVSIEAKNSGYHIILTYAEEDDYLSIVKQKRVDGLILVSPGNNHKSIITQLKKMNIPFVATSRVLGVSDINYICTDDFQGACSAVEHLVLLGHRSIGFINGPSTLASSEDRLEGYRTTLLNYGIPYDEKFVKKGDTSISSGYSAMSELLKDGNVTGVFVASDLMAAGAIKAINDQKLSVPDSISIIGFDDIPLAGYLNPPLTTVRQNTFEKSKLATKMLINTIKSNSKEHLMMKMQVELVVRKSTKSLSL